MRVFYVFIGLVVLSILYFIAKFIASNSATKKLHKSIFEKGTRRSGVVVGWYDLDGRRHEDDSQDIIYTGGNSEKDSYSYTQVILSSKDEYGDDVEIVMDTYSNPDEETELLLSKRYELGATYDFFEFEGHRRFANERWLAE